MALFYKSLEELLSDATPEPNSGCWLWTRAASKAGYGQVWCPQTKKVVYVHRLSFALANGFTPPEVCHTCDTPLCIWPGHLFAGTHKDNFLDAAQKGRMKGGYPKKLCAEQVLAIRADERSHRAIARDYDVSHRTVGDIKNRLIWTGV